MQYQCFPIPGDNNKMCDHNHQAALFLVISNEGNTSKSGVVSVIEPPSVIVDEAYFVNCYLHCGSTTPCDNSLCLITVTPPTTLSARIRPRGQEVVVNNPRTITPQSFKGIRS